MISLLAAEWLNPLFQPLHALGNPLTIIAAGVVQRKVNIRL
jgi:hypothetical protein